MHDGIIADRYAKAFLEYTDAHGFSQAVASQVSVLLSAIGKVPAFRGALSSRDVPVEKKLALLAAAVDPEPLHPAIDRLFALLCKNGRIEQFRMVVLDYLVLYRKENNIRIVQVTTAGNDPEVVENAGHLAEKYFGQNVVTVHRVNPELIGGFIVDSWGWRLDASVRGALEKTRKKMIVNNKRKV